MKIRRHDKKGSEIRTISIQKQPGDGHQIQERELLIQLDAAWRDYRATEGEYRASRVELGRILSELQALLARTGRNGRFATYLREKGIAKSTAYDLLEDYGRLRGLDLPKIVVEVACEENIDLSAKRLDSAVRKLAPKLKAVTTRDQAKPLLDEVRKAGKRRSGRVGENLDIPEDRDQGKAEINGHSLLSAQRPKYGCLKVRVF